MLNCNRQMATLGALRIHLLSSHFTIFVVEAEWSMIRREHCECPVGKASPDRFLVKWTFSRRRAANTFGALEVFSLHVRSGKVQILRTSLPVNGNIPGLCIAYMLHSRLFLSTRQIWELPAQRHAPGEWESE